MGTKKTTAKLPTSIKRPAALPKGGRRVERPRFWAFSEAEATERTVIADLLSGSVVDFREVSDWGDYKQSFLLMILDRCDADGEAIEGRVAVKCIGNLLYQVRDAGLREELTQGVVNRIRVQWLGKSEPTAKRLTGRNEFDLVVLGEVE